MEKHIELDSISQIIEKKCTDVKMYIQSAIAKVLLDNKNILPQLEDLECIINTTFSDFF
jgi:hypothetical protein